MEVKKAWHGLKSSGFPAPERPSTYILRTSFEDYAYDMSMTLNGPLPEAVEENPLVVYTCMDNSECVWSSITNLRTLDSFSKIHQRRPLSWTPVSRNLEWNWNWEGTEHNDRDYLDFKIENNLEIWQITQVNLTPNRLRGYGSSTALHGAAFSLNNQTRYTY